MYYRLNNRFAFRGWKGLPYAIKVLYGIGEDNKPFFCNKETYETLLKCDGKTNINEELLNGELKNLLNTFIKQDIIECSNLPLKELEEYQKYQLYETAYMTSFLWSITGKCNYKCRHCLLSAPDFKQAELNMEECKHIIKELSTSGITSIDISGGEPFVRRDFWQIIDELSNVEIGINTIFTNGRLINEKFIEELDKRNMYPVFQISFDGAGWHDWLRGIDGAEKETIRAIKLLTDSNRIVNCAMCIHKNNKDSIRDTVKLLSDIGVSKLNINAPKCMGCWADYSKQYALREEEEIEVIKKYIPKYFEDGAPIDIVIDGFFRGIKGKKEFIIPLIHNIKDVERFKKYYICETARYRAYISSEGQVMPCMGFSGSSISDKFPSLLEKSLAEITTYSFFRDVIFITKKQFLENNNECRECPHLLKCDGGCSASALNDTDDFCGIDQKICNFHKKNFADEIRKAVPDGIIEK